MDEVGHQVRRLREERGWNQAKLAVVAGMAPSAVNQIENGKRAPSANSLSKLAAALEVEVPDLFPKAQAPLPLESAPEQQVRGGELPEAPVTYTAYEALGRMLSLSWQDDLKKWDEKLPPGDDELAGSDQVFGLLAWWQSITDTKGQYETIARESGFLNRPEFDDTLALMEEVHSAGTKKLLRIIKRMKTNVEFHRIIKANEGLKDIYLDA